MIYRLEHNIDHISEEGVHDASLIRFAGDVEARFSNPTIDYAPRVPAVLEFVGNLSALNLTDYPYLDRTLPLMSWRLLNTLLSAGAFEYRTFPTRIYSDTLTKQVRRTSDYTRTDYQVNDPNQYTERFSIVQLLRWTNVVNRHETICAELVSDQYQPRRASEIEDGFIDTELVERLVLDVEEDALPGLFRVQGMPGLFCAEKSVQACRASGIVGVNFTPIPVPLYRGARDIEGGKRIIASDLMPQ